MRLSAIIAVAVTLLALPVRAETPPAFTSPQERDHPLVGHIWRPATQSFLSPQSLAEQAEKADIVLLGETHDNADHHALQAWMVRRLMETPIKPLLAFEMFDAAQAPALETYLSTHPRDADGLAAAVEWEKSGWPDWRMYRPIAQAALNGGAVLAAANLSRDDTKIIAKGNIPPAWTGKLGLEKPQDPADRQAMEEDIQAGHCNMLPARALPAMVRVQRGRDAAMAWTLSQSPRSVLIAGAGHVRADRAVPRHLAEMAPGRNVLTIAFIEVVADKTDPAAYAATYETDRLPFDAVWFTPRAEREDQCEAFRQHMDKKKD
ncbi:ChaN family lipoprotein [Magnetospirillum sulfuroxidans]|uniref:ChaN family lipoprotein n=1 Tax=Magnetospirillum sulfuroxidans TaxID=611300 RepID=A0ABS5I9I3_9PROT|nr:ChaN family lipoprotein [Magnetospirillum sulfuroxidans]MBR9971076.1 ChaN family lipoprotein [Magnetospirillum sulfuroxidans]